MEYKNVIMGRFMSRPNRFIAMVEVDGCPVRVHVPNTGRCKELLVPGVLVYLARGENPLRRTAYSLIAVQKGDILVNMDSQAPNAALREWIAQGGLGGIPQVLRPEAVRGGSRLDFYVEIGPRHIWVEAKGVTLECDGHALFPDAPTLRGTKHLTELTNAVLSGEEAWVVFVIQMGGMKDFAPNTATDPAFSRALQAAKMAGVRVFAAGCEVLPDRMTLAGEVPCKI